MDSAQRIKKEYLFKMFNSIQGEDVGLEEYESVRWFELRGFTYEEARLEVFNKYRSKLLNDDIITQAIVEYQDVTLLFNEVFEDEPNEEESFKCYVDSLSSTFSATCNFSILNGNLIDPNNITEQIREIFIANEIVQGMLQQKEYREAQLRQYENLINTVETKAEKLGNNITPYGFFDLPKLEVLSDKSKIELMKLIANNGTPYAIAMFHYLGFIEHLMKNYLEFSVQSKLSKKISKWLEIDYTGRIVRGNLLTLNEKTNENKDRYTAHKQTKKVEKDYEKLK